jgi:hypothetical protein
MRCAPPFSFLHHAGPEKADIYRPPAPGFGVFGWLQADTVAAVWTAAAAIHREKNTVEAAAAAGLQPQRTSTPPIKRGPGGTGGYEERSGENIRWGQHGAVASGDGRGASRGAGAVRRGNGCGWWGLYRIVSAACRIGRCQRKGGGMCCSAGRAKRTTFAGLCRATGPMLLLSRVRILFRI